MVNRKILQANIKTVDDKNHIRVWNESEIESITFKEPPKIKVDKPIFVKTSSITTKLKKTITKKK